MSSFRIHVGEIEYRYTTLTVLIKLCLCKIAWSNVYKKYPPIIGLYKYWWLTHLQITRRYNDMKNSNIVVMSMQFINTIIDNLRPNITLNGANIVCSFTTFTQNIVTIVDRYEIHNYLIMNNNNNITCPIKLFWLKSIIEIRNERLKISNIKRY